MSHIFLPQVAELIPDHPQTHATAQRTGRPSACARNIGMTLDLFVQVVAHIAAAALPHTWLPKRNRWPNALVLFNMVWDDLMMPAP